MSVAQTDPLPFLIEGCHPAKCLVDYRPADVRLYFADLTRKLRFKMTICGKDELSHRERGRRAAVRAFPLALVIGLLCSPTALRGEALQIGIAHLDTALQLAREWAGSPKRETSQTYLPTGSWLQKQDSISADSVVRQITVGLFSPWARAARLAAAAEQGRVRLDSLFWKPAIFNAAVLLVVEGHQTTAPTPMQIKEVLCLADGVIQEPNWSQSDTLKSGTLASGAVNFQATFTPDIFDGSRDIDVFVSTNLGAIELKFYAKELTRLR